MQELDRTREQASKLKRSLAEGERRCVRAGGFAAAVHRRRRGRSHRLSPKWCLREPPTAARPETKKRSDLEQQAATSIREAAIAAQSVERLRQEVLQLKKDVQDKSALVRAGRAVMSPRGC